MSVKHLLRRHTFYCITCLITYNVTVSNNYYHGLFCILMQNRAWGKAIYPGYLYECSVPTRNVKSLRRLHVLYNYIM